MKKSYLLIVTLSFIASLQVHAVSFEKTETKLQKFEIDPEKLSDLLNKQVSDWQNLTPRDKELAVKGTIINLDMETSDNDALLEKHTHASIQCMDTEGHGLNLSASEDINLPLVRCITDTVKELAQKIVG